MSENDSAHSFFSSKNQFGLFFLKPVLIKIFVNLLAPQE